MAYPLTVLFFAALGILQLCTATATPPSTLPIPARGFEVAGNPKLRGGAGAFSIMIVGDSITQGHEGDWTWRYRLWEWFDNEGIAVDFVGPFIGTFPPDSDIGPSAEAMSTMAPPPGVPPTGPAITFGGYAVGVKKDFDSNHFGAWGRQLALDRDLIHSMVQAYNPDYLLVLLGFNDLAWYPFFSSEDLLQNMESFVHQARTAKPNMKFLIGNIPQRLRIEARPELAIRTDKYNELLADAIPSWSTTSSPVALAKMRELYACDLDACPAAYDGLHPNVLGEYQIAQAFSRTLVESFQIGSSELVVPPVADLPVRPISVPQNLTAVSNVTGVAVTWDPIYGALGYQVRFRMLGEDTWDMLYVSTLNKFYTEWRFGGDEEWEYMVRAINGIDVKTWGDFSGIVSSCTSSDVLLSQTRQGRLTHWYRGHLGCSWR
jgi:lysophospholipase L1-like esterase